MKPLVIIFGPALVWIVLLWIINLEWVQNNEVKTVIALITFFIFMRAVYLWITKKTFRNMLPALLSVSAIVSIIFLSKDITDFWAFFSAIIVFGLWYFEDKKISKDADDIKELNQRLQREAELELYLNGEVLEEGKEYIVYGAKQPSDIKIRVKNVGNKYAPQIQAYLSISHQDFQVFWHSPNWIYSEITSSKSNKEANNYFELIYIVREFTFPGNFFGLPSIVTRLRPKNKSKWMLRVYYDEQAKKDINFYVTVK